MKPEELRVGNWYKSVKFGVPVRCHITDLYELCVMSDGATDDPPIKEMFEPIPLDEEWLVKFGFIYSNGVSWSMDKEYNGLVVADDDSDDWYAVEWYGASLTTVTYVHQLQNLYYALTGEELKINY